MRKNDIYFGHDYADETNVRNLHIRIYRLNNNETVFLSPALVVSRYPKVNALFLEIQMTSIQNVVPQQWPVVHLMVPLRNKLLYAIH